MKKISFFLLGIFMSFSVSMVIAQELQTKGLRITWPLNRTIIQQNASGSASFRFFAQWLSDGNIGTSAAIRFQYRISTIDMTNGNNPVAVSGHDWSTVSAAVENVQRYYSAGSSISDLKVLAIPSNTGDITLPKGWYTLEMRVLKKPNLAGWSTASYTSVRFGIGDVFMIYGQSNAQGYVGGEVDDKNLVSYTTDVNYVQRDAMSTIARRKIADGNFKIRGLPIVTTNNDNDSQSFGIRDDGFSKLEKTGNRENIYPNGDVSWSWAPLGDKLVAAGTPTLFINNAVQDAEISWLANPNEWGFKRFRASLQTYGHILGLRGVLYHQGEKDAAKRLSDGNESYAYYGQKMTDLVDLSRTALGGQSLRWNFAKASYFTSPSNACYQQFNDPYCVHNNNINAGNTTGNFGCIPLSNCTQTQSNNSACPAGVNCNFIGVSNPNDWYNKFNNYNDYNNLLTNVQQNTANSLNSSRGNINTSLISTDDLGLTARGPHQGIHFNGSTLSTVAQRWKDIGISNGSPVESKLVYAYTSISKLSNGYQLTAPTGFDRYFWVINDGDIYSALQSGTSNVYTTNGLTSTEFKAITCYMGKSTGQPIGDNNGWNLKFEITHPFLIPGYQGNKALTAAPLPSASNSAGQVSLSVTASNLTWEATENSNWFSITGITGGGDGTTQILLNVDANTSANQRTEYVTITEDGGGLFQTIAITQNGNSSCTQTNLSSLTPTSESFSYTGKKNNLSITGQTLMVGGYQTSNGVGTHANNTLIYALNGQYSTFSGSVGRDDAADNCGCGTMKVQFVIKADGTTLFTSNLLGTADGRQVFSVDVSGKNNLELIVNDAGDNNWGDHADWLDAILYCGTPSTCTTALPIPTNVTSSPSSISSGSSSTLSATCATGVVVWNTGQTANAITVSPPTTTSYNAKCVNASCPASNAVSVGVTVSTSACSAISNGLVMGTWTATSQALVARFFNGQYWLTQRVGTNPDVFVVRGSAMLQRSDVVVSNASYLNLIGCFAWQYSDWGNLGNPPTATFPTPTGYSLGYASDGTMIYTANSGNTGGTGTCTDAYVSNNWASATIGDGFGPKIGQNYQGGTMNINGTTFSQGIGTHAGSEIVYNLGNHAYANFKASVGRDIGSYSCNCGGQSIVFKVYNHATGALIGSSTNNPVTKTINQSASDMVVPIAGISSIRLVVEDGGDQIWGDWADWGKARFTCAGSNFRETAAPTEEWFWVSPNPNDGKFIAKINLKTAQSVQLYLSDIRGNIIKEYTFVGTEGINNFEINIQDKVMLESIYNIRCQTGENAASKRVIVEK